jgi:tetratricopeptide (TPR) repeat protein
MERMYMAEEPGDMKAALEDLEAAIQGGVKEAMAFWARGTVQLLVGGDTKKSVEDYRKAVDLAPLHAGYRASLAQLLSGMTLVMPVAGGDGNGKQRVTGSDEALGEAETHYGLACELEPENEDLRKARETFLDLLQKKTGTK